MDNPKNKTRIRTNRRGVTKTVAKTKDVSPSGTVTKTRTSSRVKDLALGRKKLGNVGLSGVSAKSGTRSLVKQKTKAKSTSGDKVKVKSVTGSLNKKGTTLTRDGFIDASYNQKYTATKEKSSGRGLKRNVKTGSLSTKYNSDASPVVKNKSYKEAISKARKIGK